MKPNISLLRQWAQALRSGKYSQGTRYLRVGDAYCCLGVACDLVNPKGWTRHDSNSEIYTFGFYQSYPPPDVNTRFGVFLDAMRGANGDSFAALNDRGVSFETIADYIDAFCDRHAH